MPNAPGIGFIHVPALPGSDPEREGMPLEKMILAVRGAIEAIAHTERQATLHTTNSRRELT
jgi:pyrrolidone-carboxylate peptidase